MKSGKKTLSILGATGSIGRNALRIVDENRDGFRVAALSCGKNLQLLAEQISKYSPDLVSVGSKADCVKLEELLKGKCKKGTLPKIAYGDEGAIEVATIRSADIVISAIVGAAALKPTWAAIKSGRRIALANKESIVMAGRIMMKGAKRSGASILPVDSEHSAIFQSMLGHNRADIKRLILTASGGPFFDRSRASLQKVGLKEVLNHPNWKMGRKITIDSATLMNKALEVIEARWLFDIEPSKISVLIHPQSIVHSMVEYKDGSLIAQMGIPDMRIPISYALAYPERLSVSRTSLKLEDVAKLTFAKPSRDRFPTLEFAYDALNKGDSAAVVLNAVNEASVNAFICGKIKFLKIPAIIERIYAGHSPYPFNDVEDALVLHDEYTKITERFIERL